MVKTSSSISFQQYIYCYFIKRSSLCKVLFRDNAPQPRLHIDRKRMRELQELRIALGHQPDDHEEEQTQTWGGMTMKGW